MEIENCFFAMKQKVLENSTMVLGGQAAGTRPLSASSPFLCKHGSHGDPPHSPLHLWIDSISKKT